MPSRIRVGLYLDTYALMGGQFQYTLSILEAIQSNSDSFELIAYCAKEEWIPICESHRVSIGSFITAQRFLRAVTFLSRKFSPRGVAPKAIAFHGNSFARTLRADLIDVCIFPMPTTLACEVPLPTICSIHDLMYKYESHFPEITGVNSLSWFQKTYGSILRYCDTVLVDSVVGKGQILETFSPVHAHIAVLPYCAPLYVRNNKRKMNEDRDGYEAHISDAVIAATKKRFIFYPAVHGLHKNHKRLLDAVALLMHEGIEVNLVLAGTHGQATPGILSAIEKNVLDTCVTILPYVSNEELCYLYSRAQALVMPTFAGPTNIPQLEAFELGCPVLTSRIYGIPDQVGDAAILFNPNSTQEIAEAIKKIWQHEDVRGQLIERGFIRGRELGFDVFAARLKDIIFQTVNQGESYHSHGCRARRTRNGEPEILWR